MRNKLIILICVTALAIFFYKWHQQSGDQNSQTASETNPLPSKPESTSKTSTARTSKSEELSSRTISPEPNLDDRVKRYTDGSVDLTMATKMSSKLHQSDNPQVDLEIVSQILSQYRSIFKNNPVGVENFEFTAALTGDNPKRVNFLDPSNSALSANDELIDRWGSPIYFHPISGTEMELRSLGPDKTLWTADDIELKP